MTINGPDPLPLPQAVLAPLTRAAIFLVVTVKPEPESYATVRSFCGDLAGLFARWSSVTSRPDSPASRPSDPMPGTGSSGIPGPPNCILSGRFRAGDRHAVATPGDMLFHIRAQRMDICFELATQIMERIGDAVSPVPTRCTASVTSRIAT